MKNKYLSLMVPGKTKIKGLIDLVSGSFLCISHGGKSGRALWGLFSKDTNPIYEGSPYELIISQR